MKAAKRMLSLEEAPFLYEVKVEPAQNSAL